AHTSATSACRAAHQPASPAPQKVSSSGCAKLKSTESPIATDHSMPFRRDRRAAAPHAATRRLRARLRALQLVKPAEWQAGTHAREAGAKHLRVHEESIVADDVRERSPVLVAALAVRFQMDESTQDERREVLPRFFGECRGRVEAGAYLGRVDAKQ